MSILEELYDGNIAPMERAIRRGSEYHKILKRTDEQKKGPPGIVNLIQFLG